jgi:hypothetical protein
MVNLKGCCTMTRKATVKPVSAPKGVKRGNPPPAPAAPAAPAEEAYSEPSWSGYTPDILIDGAPAWNGRLPWLADVPLCTGYHNFKRDKVTSYVYCFTCGISCGLV